MIHEVKGSRQGNATGEPLFFCTECGRMFIGVVGMDSRSRLSDGWPPGEPCPECNYLDGQNDGLSDDDGEELEAGDPPLPSGTNDDRS